MDQRALQHPGDDLHVAVRVGLEAGARVDDVVVVDQQQAVVGVARVVVLAERERVLGVEPAEVALGPVVGPADVDLGGPLGGGGAHGDSFPEVEKAYGRWASAVQAATLGVRGSAARRAEAGCAARSRGRPTAPAVRPRRRACRRPRPRPGSGWQPARRPQLRQPSRSRPSGGWPGPRPAPARPFRRRPDRCRRARGCGRHRSRRRSRPRRGRGHSRAGPRPGCRRRAARPAARSPGRRGGPPGTARAGCCWPTGPSGRPRAAPSRRRR